MYKYIYIYIYIYINTYLIVSSSIISIQLYSYFSFLFDEKKVLASCVKVV